MSLQDLEKKIYDNQNQKSQNGQAGNFGFQNKPIQGSAVSENINVEEKIEADFIEKKKKARLRKKIFWIAGISAAILFLTGSAALYFILRNKTAFREKDILFSLEYPEEVMNGKEENIKIKYGNFSKVGLKNVSISFRYPDTFDLVGNEKEALAKDWDIGSVKAGESKTLEIPIRVFAVEGSLNSIEGTLQYTPENFNSIFKKTESGRVRVDSLPIKIILETPKETPSGRKINYKITCENLTSEEFSNLILRIDFPSGFVLESIKSGEIEEKIADDKIMMGDLGAYENKIYDILGSLSGEIGQGKVIKAQAGFEDKGKFRIFDSSESSTLVKQSEISLTQTIAQSGSASWGSTLEFKIVVKNTSETGLSGVKVFADIEGETVNLSSIDPQEGAASGNGLITWDSSGVPEFAYFAPLQEKELSFSLRVKDRITIKNSSMKNFIISSTPSAEAIELKEKIAGEKLETKVRSKLILNSLGFYYEDGKIKNTGPVPPKVGQTTTYSIHWQLVNWTNDVTGVKASTVLPPGVGWSNNTSVTRGNLYFNNVTRTVFWEIDSIPANTGIISPIYDAVFQISITPAQSDAGKSIKILGKTTVVGVDSFTGENLFSEAEEKTTELREDGKLNSEGYRVTY